LIGDERDVFGYSAIHFKSKMIIFGFRGTRNLKNWINNLMIARPNAPFPSAPANARIHYGFLADYQKVGDQFTDMFKKYVKEFPDFDIKIMGHSLGGALALLGTVDLITHNLLVSIDK
jgi:predicted lipase